MKKLIAKILVVLIILIGGIYLFRNIIIKKVLEYKLTEINKGKVDIDKVNFSLFDKNITIKGIEVTSRSNGYLNLVTLEEFSADYDLFLRDRKILITNANFTQVDFMTKRKTNGSIGYVEDIKVDTLSNEQDKIKLNSKKDDAIRSVEELLRVKSEAGILSLQSMLEEQNNELKLMYSEKKNYWENRLDKIKKSRDYIYLEEINDKIIKDKNILGLLRLKNETKEIKTAFINVLSQLKDVQKEMREDFKNVLDTTDFKSEIKDNIEKIVDRSELMVGEFDDIVNYFFNEIYRDEIDQLVEKYRSIMKELELRIEEDKTNNGAWELFIENVNLKTKTYGIVFEGNIKNVSSRLSKNVEPIEMKLTAQNGDSYGEIDGNIDLLKLNGEITLDINNFRFEDLKDYEGVQKYINSGIAGLKKKIILTKDNIQFIGDVEIHNINLNEQFILEKLNIDLPLLNNIFIPLIKDINTGKIHYSFKTDDNQLVMNSNIAKEMLELLNDRGSILKKQLSKELVEKSQEKIEVYRENLEMINKNYVSGLNVELDKQLKYFDEIEKVLEKLDIKLKK